MAALPPQAVSLFDAGVCPVERFLALESGLLRRAEENPGERPALLIARMREPALVLGRFQRRESALSAGGAEGVRRRLSGGRTIAVGEGVLALAVVVPRMGDLLDAPIPPARFINRYVRGVLAGLTRAGAPNGAHYFGRDFISAESQQLAVVGQQGGASAGVLEVFIAVNRSLAPPPDRLAYPPHADPRAGGPAPTALAQLRTSETSLDGVVKAVVNAFAETYRCSVEPTAVSPELPALQGELSPEEDERGWASSGVAEIPIGFMEALVQMDGAVIRSARIRGDFMAPAFAIRQMEQAVVGLRPQISELGKVVDAAFHQPGAFILGMNELRLFADALLEAADESIK